jgi:diguanylate cyclase (GGDEF)-like protein
MNTNLREQIHLYQSQAVAAFWGNVIGSGLLVFVILPATSHVKAAIWMAAQVIFNIVRYLLTRRCSHITMDSDVVIERRYRYFYGLVIISGLLWGSSFFIYPTHSMEHQLLFFLVITSTGAVATSLLNSMPRLYITWITLFFTPIFMVTLLDTNTLSYRLSFMLVVLYIYMVSTARTYRENLLASIELRIKLQQQASIDALTGIPNRRFFMEEFQNEWQRATRHQHCITLIMIDIDHFKKLNDSYGHQKGDECLQTIAQLLHNNIRRSGEFAARIGGEEFAIVLPDTKAAHAINLAEKLRSVLRETKFSGDGGSFNITVSMGIASATPTLGISQQKLFQLADKAMYKAKADGRDRYEHTELNCSNLPGY